MSTRFLVELSSDYEKLIETEIGYNVIIFAEEEPNIKEIHANSNILCIRSQYFRSAFSNDHNEFSWKQLESQEVYTRELLIKNLMRQELILNGFILLII